ncbi:RhsIA family immunity protein [Gemmata sp. JC717]|uniref:RhsIA family immunity protein n=1 Tax=Gemmata algarum TaxID=2975278 RepID=UPI0021BAD2B9|nr:RhsIA family immunity protein [Gemmata algarum]MDY3557393.1 RhsIA family immunity protein [Gemmata algarum]
MSNEILEDLVGTVLAFAKAYSDWERGMAESGRSFNNPQLREEHARILATFCTLKRRAYIDGGVTFATPPTYSELDAEKIDAVHMVTKSKAHVDTKVLKFLEYRFVVLKKRDGWRIDSLKCRMPPSTEWNNTLIGM